MCVGLEPEPALITLSQGCARAQEQGTCTKAHAELSWTPQRAADKVKQHRGAFLCFVFFLMQFIIQGLVPPEAPEAQ